MIVIGSIAQYHRCSEAHDLWKIVPAVGWTLCPQPVQVHDCRPCLVA